MMLNAVKRLLPVALKNYVKRRVSEVRHIIARDTSQNFEVSYLRTIIPADFPRYIVDVGAYDGKYLSNSYYFVRVRGWGGILIEPEPEAFRALARFYAGRPNVACVNKACSNRPGMQKLYLGTHRTRSTLSVDDSQWFKQHRTHLAVDVETDTLTNILAAYRCPADFGILSVDAEGLDYEVLLGLDFARFCPRIVITEDERGLDEPNQKKYQLLQERGYRLVNRLGLNTIWGNARNLPVVKRSRRFGTQSELEN